MGKFENFVTFFCLFQDDASPSDNTTVVIESIESVAPQSPSLCSPETDETRPQSRLSARTGSEEIKQNGDSELVISQYLTSNSFLEDKDVGDLDMSITEPTPEEPEDAEEDRELAEEQDTKFEDRKDPEDPDGGGGNTFGGNSNSLADDSNSFENGDSSSQNTQPEPECKNDGGTTDCGSSLNLTRSLSEKTSFRVRTIPLVYFLFT